MYAVITLFKHQFWINLVCISGIALNLVICRWQTKLAASWRGQYNKKLDITPRSFVCVYIYMYVVITTFKKLPQVANTCLNSKVAITLLSVFSVCVHKVLLNGHSLGYLKCLDINLHSTKDVCQALYFCMRVCIYTHIYKCYILPSHYWHKFLVNFHSW